MTISERMSISQKQENVRSAPSQPVKRTYEYFEEVKAEFFKINWTDGAEVFSYAKIVVGSTFAFGILIYVADLVVHRALAGFDGLFKLLIG
jgi:preprotein translocase SecE subunit